MDAAHNGTCEWEYGYRFVFESDRMGAYFAIFGCEVEPGERSLFPLD
jgi:hypothetical protein